MRKVNDAPTSVERTENPLYQRITELLGDKPNLRLSSERGVGGVATIKSFGDNIEVTIETRRNLVRVLSVKKYGSGADTVSIRRKDTFGQGPETPPDVLAELKTSSGENEVLLLNILSL